MSRGENPYRRDARYNRPGGGQYDGDGRRDIPSDVDLVKEARHWWRGLSEEQMVEIMIGNVQGGWRETLKFKDKNGRWVTRTIWGSGKAGW